MVPITGILLLELVRHPQGIICNGTSRYQQTSKGYVACGIAALDLTTVRGTTPMQLRLTRHVKTTMTYTHVLNRGPKAVQSPADRLWKP